MSDKEADRDLIYFLCAYYFHWTPEQVRAADAVLVDSLMEILPPFLKKVNDVSADGRH